MVSLRMIRQKLAMGEELPRRRSERLQEQSLKNKNKIGEVNSEEFEKLFKDELTDVTCARGSRKRGRKRKQQLDGSVKMFGTADEDNRILDVKANPLNINQGRTDEKRLDVLEQPRWTYQPTNESIFQQAFNNPSELVPVTNDFNYKESLMRFAKTAGPLAETVAEKYYERNKAMTLHKQQQQQQQQQQQYLLQLQLQRQLQYQLLQQQHQQQSLLAGMTPQWQKSFPVVPPPNNPSFPPPMSSNTTPLSQPRQSYLNLLDPNFKGTIHPCYSKATAPSNIINMNPQVFEVNNLMARNFCSDAPPINTGAGSGNGGGQILAQHVEGHNASMGMNVAKIGPEFMQHQALTSGSVVHNGDSGWKMNINGRKLDMVVGNGSVPLPAPQQRAVASPSTTIFGVDVGNSNRGLFSRASSSQGPIFGNN